MQNSTLVRGLLALPGQDKSLLKAFVFMAVLTFGLGIFYGTATAFGRAGFIDLDAERGYQFMTLHGVTIFFYWLYFVQAVMVLVLAASYTEGADRIALRPLAWIAFAVMTLGFTLSEGAMLAGVSILYNAPPEVITDHDQGPVGYFYLGYLLLGVGLIIVALPAIWTAVKPRLDGKCDTWSAVAFAAVAFAGLLIVSGMAAINAFLPAALWAFKLTENVGMTYQMGWNLLFHNVHYLPLMAMVLLWYVLVETTTGVKSIFGARFSKIVFASYLVFVPPTSLYHMFLEPNLPPLLLLLGSVLSLFISVPTVLVFLVIVVSLEVHARAAGARGLFGWIGLLPWKNPAMAAIGMAVVNLALGGGFSFVLISERLAPLLSDTFFVPGYFHFLTLGAVSLTFIAALLYIIPAITGRRLWRPDILAKLPFAVTAGLSVFAAGGIWGGYMGVPRRVFDITYGGEAPEAWLIAMTLVGIGATIMALAMAVYVYALGISFLTATKAPAEESIRNLTRVTWGGLSLGRHKAWTGPLAVLVLVIGMYAFSGLAFEIMNNLPVAIEGGGH